MPDPTIRALAEYSLQEAFVRLGRPMLTFIGNPSEGMITYGPVPVTWSGAALHYDERCYDPTAAFSPVPLTSLWAPTGIDAANVDLIGGIGRLLTLADESQVSETCRNERGIFHTSALPSARQRVRAEPLVEQHIAALARELEVLVPNLPASRPLWPHGRLYSLVLTHDTDSVTLNAPQEILFNAAKAVIRVNGTYARMTWAGLVHRSDPLLGFRAWAEMETSLGVRSAFLISARHVVRRHLNDCRSTVFNQDVDWDWLRSLADAGWEFGCHPAIRATDKDEEFFRGRSTLEAKLLRPVQGLRHHYLALDWRRPYLTFRQHVRAGFRHEMSIGWKDSPGFRAGTCLPYRPYDPELRRALDLYELPTAIMDSQIVRADDDPNEAEHKALEVVRSVRDVGGMLILNWHTEASLDKYCYRNCFTVLRSLLRRLREDSDVWFCTPSELTQYWMERRHSLLSSALSGGGS
jgi:hypothetical protein